MDDYIKRETAISAANIGADTWDGAFDLDRHMHIRDAINCVPAADVEAVVRCKDCRYYDESIHFCALYKVKHFESFYCHDGTRSE